MADTQISVASVYWESEVRPMAQTKQLEIPAEREARLAYEREMLIEADADLAAGRYLTGPALEEWLDALVGDGELPSLEELRTRYPDL
jgi:hypothetical protein